MRARALGVAFHENLMTGASVSEALWKARVKIAKDHPDDPTPLLYIGSGVPWLRAMAPMT